MSVYPSRSHECGQIGNPRPSVRGGYHARNSLYLWVLECAQGEHFLVVMGGTILLTLNLWETCPSIVFMFQQGEYPNFASLPHSL